MNDERTEELAAKIRAKKAATESAEQDKQRKKARLGSDAWIFFTCFANCLASWARRFNEDSLNASDFPRLVYDPTEKSIALRREERLPLYLSVFFDERAIGVNYAFGTSEGDALRGFWPFELKDNYAVLVVARPSHHRIKSIESGSSFSGYVAELVYEILGGSV